MAKLAADWGFLQIIGEFANDRKSKSDLRLRLDYSKNVCGGIGELPIQVYTNSDSSVAAGGTKKSPSRIG